jgi:malate synthase
MGARGPKGTEHLYRRGRIWWCWFYEKGGELQRRSCATTDKAAARVRLAEYEREALDPAARKPQSLNDALHALLDERRATTTAQNVSFLESKAAALVAVLGHDLPITSIEDAKAGRGYIEARRRLSLRGKRVSDRCIKRELEVLVMALRYAKGAGRWSGDLDAIIPDDFHPDPTPKGDTITRDQALRIFPRLTPDAAAAVAFSLATGAERAALGNALRSDIPADLTTCDRILVRGTKTAERQLHLPADDNYIAPSLEA